ncbi:MAG: ferric reductase-like transmembrane domain-containing protein [Acidimicrobiales bacterium]
MNEGAGRWVAVSPDTVLLVERAILASVVTDGRFDPTVLGDVIRAGYDRDFALVAARDAASSSPASPFSAASTASRSMPPRRRAPGERHRLRSRWHRQGPRRRPGRRRLDAEGAAGALINLGATCAVGCGPDGDDWAIELDPPPAGCRSRPSASARRHRHQHHPAPPLGARRRGAPPPDRSGHRPPDRRRPGRRVGARRPRVAGRGPGQRLAGRRPRRRLRLVERLGADALLVDRHGALHRTAGFDRFEILPHEGGDRMTAWYVNCAAGLVAWALLAGSVGLGILLSSKLLGKRVRPNWQLDLHRGLSALAVAFTGVHVAGAVADNWIHLGWAEVLVPGTSSWRPLAVAWGVVTMYLLAAVQITSLLRKRLSKRAWKRVHFASYPLFLTATAHGVTAGTEMGTTIGIAVAALVTAALAGLTAMRVVEEQDRRAHPAPARPARVPARAGSPF